MNHCRIEGCERPVYVVSRALCKAHYDQMRNRGQIPKRIYREGPCSVEGCDRGAGTGGMCDMHYRRQLHNGTTEARSLESRFWKYVPERPENKCWEWRGTKNHSGYGVLRADRSENKIAAHRVSYELHKGPIPDGLTIDHLCMNRGCVNPSHLEAVTLRENILRGGNMAAFYARRTVCHICGGELVFKSYQKGRACMACMKRRGAKKRAKRFSGGSS